VGGNLPICDALDRTSGYTDHGRQWLHVANHDGTGADDGLAANANVLDDRGPDSDERPGLDRDAPAESRSGTDVRGGPDHRLVIHDRSRVEDDGIADLAVGTDHGPGCHHDIPAQCGAVRDVR